MCVYPSAHIHAYNKKKNQDFILIPQLLSYGDACCLLLLNIPVFTEELLRIGILNNINILVHLFNPVIYPK